MPDGKNRRTTGTHYEELAAEYLCAKGFRILCRNFRCRTGEVDIVAEKDGVLVFVEVKFRSGGGFGDPFEAVDLNKQRRICRTALYYCKKHAVSTDCACRFDVIAVYGDQTIRHMENAFDFQI